MKLGQKIDLDNNDKKSNIWFMSDLHYNHVNILRLNGGRGFQNIDEMNEEIVKEIKEKVKPEDILFDLGDLIWKESNEDIKVFKSILPKKSYKIIGNHDNLKNYLSGAWGSTWVGFYDILDLIIKYQREDIQITLSHYPILDWNHRFRGSWNLHGHSHGNVDMVNIGSGELRMDIGYDSTIAKKEGSFLISFQSIYNLMKGLAGGKSFREWANEKFG